MRIAPTNRMYWKCLKCRSHGCRARAVTEGFYIVSKTNDHSHEPATVMPAATTLMVADPNEPQPQPEPQIQPQNLVGDENQVTIAVAADGGHGTVMADVTDNVIQFL